MEHASANLAAGLLTPIAAAPLQEGDLHGLTPELRRSGAIEMAFCVQHTPTGGGTRRH